MSRLQTGIALLAIILLFAMGCSQTSNPVTDSTEGNPAVANSDDMHAVTGVYEVVLEPETMEFTVTPKRDPQQFSHFNFTQYLWMCPRGCLSFRVFETHEDGWMTVGAQIENPSTISVFDPRLVFANPYSIELDEFDGYTELFPGTGLQFKPFLAWAKENPFREAPGFYIGIEFFKIKYNPGSPLVLEIITECSFDMNIEEPYEIQEFGIIEGYLTPAGDTTAKIACSVLDWQDDVNWVRVDLTAFINEVVEMVNEGGIWTYELMNVNRLPVGSYSFLVEANSDNVWDVNAYDLMTIDVIMNPEAKQLVYTKASGLPNMGEVYTIYTDGTMDTPLTSYGGITKAMGFSADFSKIIYDSDNMTPGATKAFRMAVDGSNKTGLFQVSAASCSSDGMIVLLHDPVSQTMWIYNETAYEFYQLPQANVIECTMAAAAPQIGFIARPDMFAEVFTCGLYGENERQLTSDGEQTMQKEHITISDDGLLMAYTAIDPDPLEADMEIFTCNTMMPDTQVNLTANTDIDDSHPQLDSMGRVIVYISSELLGGTNVMMWDQIGGISPITTDSTDPTVAYANPDVSSDGTLFVFEKFVVLGSTTDIYAYDLTMATPEVMQVTIDGMSTMPYVSAN